MKYYMVLSILVLGALGWLCGANADITEVQADAVDDVVQVADLETHSSDWSPCVIQEAQLLVYKQRSPDVHRTAHPAQVDTAGTVGTGLTYSYMQNEDLVTYSTVEDDRCPNDDTEVLAGWMGSWPAAYDPGIWSLARFSPTGSTVDNYTDIGHGTERRNLYRDGLTLMER